MNNRLLDLASKDIKTDGKKLQENLDQFNKDFFDLIHFFPESYALYSKNPNNPKYQRINSALEQNKADMYKLYETVNTHVKQNHTNIMEQDVNIDLYKNKQSLLGNQLKNYMSEDIANQQMKTDKVEYYRRQIVELFYLLAGIGIMCGSIYTLRK